MNCSLNQIMLHRITEAWCRCQWTTAGRQMIKSSRMWLMDQITKSYRDADAIDGSNHQIASRCWCDWWIKSTNRSTMQMWSNHDQILEWWCWYRWTKEGPQIDHLFELYQAKSKQGAGVIQCWTSGPLFKPGPGEN